MPMTQMPMPSAIAPVRPRARRGAGVAVALVVAVLLGVGIAAGMGQLNLSIPDLARTLLAGPSGADTPAEAAVWAVRMPRIVLSVLVGAALAVSGALMQAVFANPLADPGIVGVSSGAALGAAATIVFGWTLFGPWTVAVAAFLAALATTLFVYTAARADGRTEVITLVLTGIAVTAFSGAGLALLMTLGDTTSREQIVFWQLGSLNGTRWNEVAIVLPVVLVTVTIAVFLGRSLDALALGERQAEHVGVHVERLRGVAILLVALATGATVAFTGVIGFVGLVVPHMVRLAIGPSHRMLLLVSALGGALLVLVADTLARTLVPGAELPIGMLTTLIGGPYFFVLLRRTRRATGAWA